MAGKTISHVQGKGSISHNNRLFVPKNVDTSRTPDNIIYITKPIAEAYSELFGKAVEEYNSRQKRSDRMIKNGYYEHLFNRSPCNTVAESANGQKSFYEDVVQIGTKDDTGIKSADAETAKQCLDEYMKGFQERNPNFRVFNAVMHLDEATPHLHIDYIPIGHYSRSVPVQNGLAQALKEMGYGNGIDAISRWRQAERGILKEICISHGLEIAGETVGRGYSMKVDEYKEHRDRINAYEAEEQALKDEIQPLIEAKDIADSVSVQGKKMPVGNVRLVSESEFETIAEQKKTLAVQKDEVRRLQNHFDKERLILNSEKEKLDGLEISLNKREADLNARDKEMTEKESYIEQREADAVELYNQQVELNERYQQVRSLYYDLEQEMRKKEKFEEQNKMLRGRIDSLTKRISDQKGDYEELLQKKDEDITAVKDELSKCREQTEQSEKEISWLKEKLQNLNEFVDKLFEIGRYMARKLFMSFDDILDQRLSGYSLKHIFGDNSRER